MNNEYLITGSAGFVGFHLSKALLNNGEKVIGIDNLNNYYDSTLKRDRLKILSEFDNFNFFKMNLENFDSLRQVFSNHKPNIIINLAAQAGVRYSIENPRAYIDSNIVGFFNILECCRIFSVDHLIYASSSSVYGANKKIPFSVDDNVDNPVSLYAATKKSNELMAYTYSHLFGIPSTGLRFFTVYGPYGRPDMAYYKFAKKIYSDQPIDVYNNGNMKRDFTYIDDIVDGIMNIISKVPSPDKTGVKYKVYNIGNSKPEDLMKFIHTIEKEIGKTAKINFLPMQMGDVPITYADISDMEKDFNFKPNTTIKEGIHKFINWYKDYYGEKK